MIVVRSPVVTMDGHVQKVGAFDQSQLVQNQAHLTVARQAPWLELFDAGVRPVDVDAVGAEETHAEDEVRHGLRRVHGQGNGDCLARGKHAPFFSTGVQETDGGQLHLAAAPASRLIPPARRVLLRGPLGQRLGRRGILTCQQPCVLAAGHMGEVRIDDAFGVSVAGELSVAQPGDVVAHLLDEPEAVGDEHDGLPPAAELGDLVQALAREGFVAHRENLVDQKDVGLDVDRHGEAEAHIHAGGVGLDGSVDELLELGERHDLVETLVDLTTRESEHDAVDDDVLTPGDLGVKAGAQLDEGGHAAVHSQGASGGLRDARNELEQGGLAGAVLSDHPESRATRHFEGHTVQRGEDLAWCQIRDETSAQKSALQGLELVALGVAAVELGHVASDDGRGAHTSSARVSRRRSKTNAPIAKVTTPATRAPPRPRQWSK